MQINFSQKNFDSACINMEESINDNISENLIDNFNDTFNRSLLAQNFNEYNMLYNPNTSLSNINDSINDNNFKIDEINNNLEFNEDIYFKNSPKENFDTRNNTPDLLNKKTKRKNETKKDEKTTCTNNKKQKCGRKSMKENNGVVHDKFKGDNIIRKIKIHIIQDKIINLINNYIKSKKLSKRKLLKLYQDDVYSLKKEKNEKIMNSTLKNIYRETKIAIKYSSEKSKYNEKLIDEIYAKSEFIELQKILNLTFLEFFEIYTHDVTEKTLSEELLRKKEDIEIFNPSNFTGINVFINELAKKEEKDGASEDKIDSYIKKVKEFCGNYKKWFDDKKGRNEELNY